MDPTPKWLSDFAGRIHETVAKPANMQRFRNALNRWLAESTDSSPHSQDILPLNRPLSLEEEYVVLAAVHDTCCPGLPRILEEEPTLDNERTRQLWSLAYHFPEAVEGKQAVLEAFLADVEEDLARSSEDSAGDQQPRANPSRNEQTGQSEETDSTTVRRKSKRSTERGEARTKLIPALSLHHKYEDGSCMNVEPIGVNDLAKLADVAPSTTTAFFKKEFRGHEKYKTMCSDVSSLITALKLLNQEYSPHHLSGAKPPGEGERKDNI